MKKWKFYSKNIPNEALGYIKANSKEEAYNLASKIKVLDINKFKLLFEVSEHK